MLVAQRSQSAGVRRSKSSERGLPHCGDKRRINRCGGWTDHANVTDRGIAVESYWLTGSKQSVTRSSQTLGMWMKSCRGQNRGSPVRLRFQALQSIMTRLPTSAQEKARRKGRAGFYSVWLVAYFSSRIAVTVFRLLKVESTKLRPEPGKAGSGRRPICRFQHTLTFG
jgi:hypothetical protein